MLFVAQNQTEPFHFECLTGPKVMEQFVQSLETIAKRVYSVKQQHNCFSGQPLIAKEEATNCWICEEPLEQNFNNPTVLDHFHLLENSSDGRITLVTSAGGFSTMLRYLHTISQTTIFTM